MSVWMKCWLVIGVWPLLLLYFGCSFSCICHTSLFEDVTPHYLRGRALACEASFSVFDTLLILFLFLYKTPHSIGIKISFLCCDDFFVFTTTLLMVSFWLFHYRELWLYIDLGLCYLVTWLVVIYSQFNAYWWQFRGIAAERFVIFRSFSFSNCDQ